MSSGSDIFDILKQELPYLQEHFQVKRIAVFGSALTGKISESSDIDLLVEFEKPLGLKFMELCDYIQSKLGREADILTPDGLSSIRVKSVADNIRKDLVYV